MKPRTATGIAGMVASARASKGWTLREAAKRTGVSFSFLCNVELGRRYPSAATVLALSTAFGLDAGVMMAAIGAEKLAKARARA